MEFMNLTHSNEQARLWVSRRSSLRARFRWSSFSARSCASYFLRSAKTLSSVDESTCLIIKAVLRDSLAKLEALISSEKYILNLTVLHACRSCQLSLLQRCFSSD